jgi:drug/metabolite transporter (DMT)-like permease
MRLLGVLLGAAAVVLIGAPESSLPDRAMAAFLPVAMIAPAFYALEGNVVARWGTRGLDPVQVLFGATLLGLPLAAVMAIGLGQWISPLRSWGAAEWAMIGAAAVNTAAYTGYVWLIGRAGAVFAAQVSYLVTLFGVGWAIVLLGERYSFWVWGAMILMLLGLALVQPRPAAPRTVRCPESS